MQKTNFSHFVQEVRKEVPQDHFSDEALKLIFDNIEDEFEVENIWDRFAEMPFNEFLRHHDYLFDLLSTQKATQKAVEKFISTHSIFLGFTSDGSVVYVDF